MDPLRRSVAAAFASCDVEALADVLHEVNEQISSTPNNATAAVHFHTDRGCSKANDEKSNTAN